MIAASGGSLRIRQANFDDADEVARIEAFVAASPEGSPFHRPLWLCAVEAGTGQSALGLVAERGGGVVGWLPLSDIASPLFGRALVSSGFAVGGGVLAADHEVGALLCHAAEELAQRRGAGSVELRGGQAPGGWQAIEGKHANFAGPLAADGEAQLLAIPRKARAEVRKGLEAGLAVTHGRDAAHRRAHYAVYAESVRNLGTPVFPRTLFEAVLDRFGEDADITLVCDGSKPVAAVLSLYHRGTVMPFWGGGTRAARRLRGNELMYFALMRHALARGCTHFDFGRSKTGSGPYAFKKNWGFTPEPLTYWSWSADPSQARNIDPTDAGFSARIALWQKLPLRVANAIGPFIARGLG